MSKIRKLTTSQDIATSVLLKTNLVAPIMTTEELQHSMKEDKFNFILMDEEQDDELETAHKLIQEEQLDEAVLSLEYDMIPSDIVLVSNDTDSKKTDNTALTEVDDNSSLWWVLAGFASTITLFKDSDSVVESPLASEPEIEPELVGYALMAYANPEITVRETLATRANAEAADEDGDGIVDFFQVDVYQLYNEYLALIDPNGIQEFSLDTGNFFVDDFTATLFHNGQESNVSLGFELFEGLIVGLAVAYVDDDVFSYVNYAQTDYIQLVGNGVIYNYMVVEPVLA